MQKNLIISNGNASSSIYTICVLHPGVFAVLLLDGNPNDSPYHRLTGSNTACFVTLLCILQKKKTRGKRLC